MLKNKLYTLITLVESSPGNYVALTSLNPGHPIFEGHFPGQPVLPGVCLLEMVKEILAEITNKSLRLTNAGSIKYLKLIDPRTEPLLKFEIGVSGGEEELKVNVSSYTKDGSPNFKMKASFA